MKRDVPQLRAETAGLARRADRICTLILRDDYPAIDVHIEIENLRESVQAEFPGRDELFEMVYVGRFRRLWEQFRSSAPPF